MNLNVRLLKNNLFVYNGFIVELLLIIVVTQHTFNKTSFELNCEYSKNQVWDGEELASK